MEEKELKYMGNTLNYKEINVPNEEDNYGRTKVFRVAKQSDAEQVTDNDSGIMRWTGGAFFDMFIDTYIKDEDYDNITYDDMLVMTKKHKK